MMKKKNPLKIVGIIIIIVSAIILFSAFPFVQQSVISFGPLEVTDIPQVSATRIAIGVIGIILGFVVYLGEKGLKIFIGK